MGFLDGIIGNASRVDPAAAAAEYGRLLARGEQVQAAYQLVRDAFLFTDRRLILVDKQRLRDALIRRLAPRHTRRSRVAERRAAWMGGQ